MNTSQELWDEAQRIICQAENRYERQRYFNDGGVTPEMEEEWRNAMIKAEKLQAQAARESQYEKAESREYYSMTEQLRNGG